MKRKWKWIYMSPSKFRKLKRESQPDLYIIYVLMSCHRGWTAPNAVSSISATDSGITKGQRLVRAKMRVFCAVFGFTSFFAVWCGNPLTLLSEDSWNFNDRNVNAVNIKKKLRFHRSIIRRVLWTKTFLIQEGHVWGVLISVLCCWKFNEFFRSWASGGFCDVFFLN